MTDNFIRERQKVQADNWIERKKQEEAENERHARNVNLQTIVAIGFAFVLSVAGLVWLVEWMRG